MEKMHTMFCRKGKIFRGLLELLQPLSELLEPLRISEKNWGLKLGRVREDLAKIQLPKTFWGIFHPVAAVANAPLSGEHSWDQKLHQANIDSRGAKKKGLATSGESKWLPAIDGIIQSCEFSPQYCKYGRAYF